MSRPTRRRSPRVEQIEGVALPPGAGGPTPTLPPSPPAPGEAPSAPPAPAPLRPHLYVTYWYEKDDGTSGMDAISVPDLAPLTHVGQINGLAAQIKAAGEGFTSVTLINWRPLIGG